MVKAQGIVLGEGTLVPVLHEDRGVIALDKPAGWLVAPERWIHTRRNLQLALLSSIQAGDPWARSRRVKYLRFVHRLDQETSGVLLFARHPNVLGTYSRLFSERQVTKIYLVVVEGRPANREWCCRAKIAPVPGLKGKMRVDEQHGRECETLFRLLESDGNRSLLEARPVTGRTHQIRVHLASAGLPVLGDRLYGSRARESGVGGPELALRAWQLAYRDPFRKREVLIRAPVRRFRMKYAL